MVDFGDDSRKKEFFIASAQRAFDEHSFDEKQREIMMYYWGLVDEREHTVEETCLEYGIDEDYFKKLLRRLSMRICRRPKKLIDFLEG